MLGPLLDALVVALAGAGIAAVAAGSGVTAGLAGTVVLTVCLWWGAAWLLASLQIFVSPLAPTVGMLATLAVAPLIAKPVVPPEMVLPAPSVSVPPDSKMPVELFDNVLPEIVEYEDHPWFIGVQFHPELKSRPFEPHPLFASFIKAAAKQSRLV